VKFGADVHDAPRENPTKFGDLLTFPSGAPTGLTCVVLGYLRIATKTFGP